MRLLLLACLLAITNAADAGEPVFKHTKDSVRQEGVPRGTVTKHVWKSTVFADTIREYWVYAPAKIDKSEPLAVMVFQDGHPYVKEDGDFRAPIVLDNLIYKGEIRPLVGIFINPGHKEKELPNNPWRAIIAALNTTRSAISTRGSCWKRYCRRSAKHIV